MEKELLYKSAEKSLANKDYFKAAEELSKLYVEYGEKNFRINYLLFISFKNLNEHERAVETAEECLENYIRDNCKFSQYLSEKILSGGMIQALHLKSFLKEMEKPSKKSTRDLLIADLWMFMSNLMRLKRHAVWMKILMSSLPREPALMNICIR